MHFTEKVAGVKQDSAVKIKKLTITELTNRHKFVTL
jgi:hypothetical protein